MPTRKKITKIGAATIAAAALLTASPAFAKDVDSKTNGVHAWSYGKNSQVAVKDTVADGWWVYALFQRQKSSTNIQLSNKQGAGKTTYSDNYPNNLITAIRGVVQQDWAPDWYGPTVATGR
ncbi:hypothetical protein [Streptomyces paromomycinus]|uniref:Lactococcin 972 family bacteriocin n=1 Tax=Streptomyces paromomycinus TaxID=92743 RepID=A0A401W1J8_STREY|nr:hypothetical protein [Streptomyces paromomycinus]GCD43187.1 hypothetical protein GKJPGBOP_02867 [Streptomyces paromomycinus]